MKLTCLSEAYYTKSRNTGEIIRDRSGNPIMAPETKIERDKEIDREIDAKIATGLSFRDEDRLETDRITRKAQPFSASSSAWLEIMMSAENVIDRQRVDFELVKDESKADKLWDEDTEIEEIANLIHNVNRGRATKPSRDEISNYLQIWVDEGRITDETKMFWLDKMLFDSGIAK